jgi:hypothetical protein
MLDLFDVDSAWEQPPVDSPVRYALVSGLGGDGQWMHSISRLFYCHWRSGACRRGFGLFNQRRQGKRFSYVGYSCDCMTHSIKCFVG